uniref:DNA-directed DNA polymerase n=1 Tax=viral metagenome TaxID=1070528 RepID=A0A6M3L6G3_9ZZZZ
MVINPRSKRGVEFCIIAEAPGEEEDNAGRCLIGRSGRLLRNCLEEAGIKDYHFTNVVKCRTHDNGVNYKPTVEQVSYCFEILLHELLCVAPKHIVLLGDTAVKAFGFNGALSKFVGKTFEGLKLHSLQRFENCKVSILFHPAYILRNAKLTSSYVRDWERIKDLKAFDESSVIYCCYIDKGGLLFKPNLPIAFDFETNGLDDLFHSMKEPKALCVAFSQKEGIAECLDLTTSKVPEVFNTHLTIAHNYKFDYKFLKLFNTVPDKVVDTLVMALLLDENQHSVKLKDLAFKVGMQGYESNLKLNIGDLEKHSVTEYYRYNCADADATLRLYNLMLPEIKKLNLEELMLSCSKYQLFLAEMELNGILVDRKALSQFKVLIGKDITLFENKLSNDVIALQYGKEINFNSSQQLSEFLVNGLGLKMDAKTATGLLSTDKTVIEDLYKKTKHPFLKTLQEYKKLSTIKSTFIDGIEKRIQYDGRVYPEYNISKAVTGRLSSSNPNLQNQIKFIDRKDELSQLLKKYNIRKIFTIPEGWKLVEFDYSQIELRILAFTSNDSAMMDAYKKGMDIHQLTADALHINRSDAKPVNFGIPYGSSPSGLYHNLISDGYEITFEKAKQFYELFMMKYKGVKRHFDNTLKLLKEQGYVTNWFGRRRRFPLYKTTTDKSQLGEFFRQAVNFPIQSTAADVIMLASVTMFNWLIQNHQRVRVIGNVHDALLFEVKNDPFIKGNIAMIKQFMETSVSLPLPMIVDVKIGDNWGELEEYI